MVARRFDSTQYRFKAPTNNGLQGLHILIASFFRKSGAAKGSALASEQQRHRRTTKRDENAQGHDPVELFVVSE